MLDPGDLTRVERRMGAVAAVHQVVNAIWALARAQQPLVEKAAEEASVHVAWVEAMVDRLAGAPRAAAGRPVLHVVLGPERAYCGALARRALDAVPRGATAILVGQRLVEAAASRPDLRVVARLGGASSHDEHPAVARAIASAILAHAESSDVHLVLPSGGAVLVGGAREPVARPPETYAPIERVLAAAVQESVTARLAAGVLEALRAEVRARVATTDSARQACERRLEELRQTWRVARQERITSEILEVVAGRSASLEERARGGLGRGT